MSSLYVIKAELTHFEVLNLVLIPKCPARDGGEGSAQVAVHRDQYHEGPTNESRTTYPDCWLLP